MIRGTSGMQKAPRACKQCPSTPPVSRTRRTAPTRTKGTADHQRWPRVPFGREVGSGRRLAALGVDREARAAVGHARLLVRRLVLVDDALAHGLVEQAACLAAALVGRRGVTGLEGLAVPTDRGLDARLDRLVPLTSLLVLAVALDLLLDVRHGVFEPLIDGADVLRADAPGSRHRRPARTAQLLPRLPMPHMAGAPRVPWDHGRRTYPGPSRNEDLV